MRSFQARCPKCDARNVSIYHDARSSWQPQGKGPLVLHCHVCGKELYGDAATAEVERQQDAHNQKLAEEEAAAEAAREAERAAAQRRPRILDSEPVAEITSAAIRRKLQSETKLVNLGVERPRRVSAAR